MACSSGQCWTNGCTGPCSASCTACANWCSSSCKGGCGSTCGNDGCSGCRGCGGCDTTCSTTCGRDGCSSCTGSCSGSCGGCDDICSGTCKDFCANTCGKENASDIYTKLALTEKFEQQNIQEIADFIFYEVTRRNGTVPENIEFSKGTVLTAEQINKIIANLAQTNHPTSYIAEKNKLGLAALGNDLINKAKEAYEEEIFRD